MNSYVRHLFNLQTKILLNHTLITFIQFLMAPSANSIYLYHTIIPVKEISKNELIQMGKKVPRTYKYEVYAQKIGSKLVIKLHAIDLTDIVIYDVILPSDRPPITFLKNIAYILVFNYRPIPTKVDKNFSRLAHKYTDYLTCYEIKRNWQNGYITTYARKKNTPINILQNINLSYNKFLSDLSVLLSTYQAFTKILIDIYQRKAEKKYSSKDKTYLLEVIYSHDYGVSLSFNNVPEQLYTQEVIPLKNFHPANRYFNKRPHILKDITLYLKDSINP